MEQNSPGSELKRQVKDGQQPQDAITAYFLNIAGFGAVFAEEVFIDKRQKWKREGLFLGKQCEGKASRHGNLNLSRALPPGCAHAKEEPEGQEIKKCQLRLGDGGYPIDCSL